MHARVTTMQMEPDRIDDSVRQLEEQDLPTFREIDGFKGFTLFADRSTGKVIAHSYWGSQDQMQASEEEVKDARQRAADTGGAASAPQIDRYEVLIDTFVG